MLSAQLDGEDDPAARALVDEHVAGCAGCRAWLDRAALVNRLTRTGVAVPDLGDRIVAALPPVPAPRSRRRFALAPVLLLALAAVGAVQLILGLDQIGGGAGTHLHAGAGTTPGHLWHESAAWNVAVGAAYLFIALRRSRPSGLMPMLSAFVGMLVLLSLNDLTGERVDGTRLVSHGFVIAGYLLVAALSRVPGGFVTPPGARLSPGSGRRWRFADEGAVTRPGLRLVPRGPVTAEHSERRAA